MRLTTVSRVFFLTALVTSPVFAQDVDQGPPKPETPSQNDPNNVLAAAEALRAGQPILAEQLANRVILAPEPPAQDRAQALLTRGLARQQLGRPIEAASDFTQAIEANAFTSADLARVYFDRGVVKDGMGETDDAIGDYTAALKLVPNFPAALNNRANAYRRAGQLAAAKADYEASLAAGNNSPEYPYYGLGQIEEANGNAAGAGDFYRKALSANPNYTLASQRLAELGQPLTVDKSVLRAPPTKRSATLKPSKAQISPNRRAEANNERAAELRPALDAKAQRSATDIAVQTKLPKHAMVQLGSFHSEDAANQAWKHFQTVAGAQLGALSPRITAVDIPGRGRLYRLQTGPVAAAAALCSSLKSQGIDCMPVKD